MEEEVAPGIIVEWFGVEVGITWGAVALIVALALLIAAGAWAAAKHWKKK